MKYLLILLMISGCADSETIARRQAARSALQVQEQKDIGEYAASCTRDLGGQSVYLYRCENKESICYVAGARGGISCKFKQ